MFLWGVFSTSALNGHVALDLWSKCSSLLLKTITFNTVFTWKKSLSQNISQDCLLPAEMRGKIQGWISIATSVLLTIDKQLLEAKT